MAKSYIDLVNNVHRRKPTKYLLIPLDMNESQTKKTKHVSLLIL